MIKADVELTESTVIDQVGRNQVVGRKRADVKDHDVKGSVLWFDRVRELRHAVLFICDERLVPLVDFFGSDFSLSGTLGGGQSRGRISRVADGGFACGSLRHEIALLRGGRTEEGRDHEEQQPAAGDGRNTNEVARGVVDQ